MAIKTINNCSLKDNGNTNEINCPVCSKQTEIRLFNNVNSVVVSSLLSKDRIENYAVCPHCASVFSVNSNYITERKNGTTCLLTPEDLTVIKKGKISE